MRLQMNPKNALLIYSGWLGDFVWLIPTIRALRTCFNTVSIVVSEVQAELAAMLKGQLLDQVFVDESRRRFASAKLVRRAAVEHQIGTFIDVKGRGKGALYIPWRTGIRAFVPSRQDAREYWLAKILHPFSRTLPGKERSAHMVDGYLSVAAFFNAAAVPVSFDVPFDARTVEEAEAVIARNELRTSRTVALNIGSAQFSKIWPAESFRRLAEALEGDLKCKVVIMGARSYPKNGDYDVMASRKFFNDGRFANIVETTDFKVDSYLLRSALFAVCVGNDSFAGHMAGSVNEVPAGSENAVRAANGKCYRANRTVTLFGPTNPRFCRPYDPTGAFNLALRPPQYPATCPYNREDHVCPHYADRCCMGAGHCMGRITVGQVVEAVEKQLKRQADANTAGCGRNVTDQTVVGSLPFHYG